MKKSVIISVVAFFSVLCTSCKVDPPVCYNPEHDMFDTWYAECYSPMRQRTSTMLALNTYLVNGDTLSAQQMLARERIVIRGWENPLDSVGTSWVYFNASGKDTVCVLQTIAYDKLRYSVRCTPESQYHDSEELYGCGSHYEVMLQHIDKGTYLANGSGYINTDGSADLYYQMQDIRMGGRKDGALCLRAYAHKYDSTVIYHYTLYDRQIVCDETKFILYNPL